MNTRSKSLRMAELDGLRGWAALGVFVWHAFDLFAPVVVDTHVGTGPDHPLLRFIRQVPVGFAFNGSFAVYLFFALSGYVLTYQLYAGNLFARAHELIARRWLRLLPVVIVGSAVGYLVLRFGWLGLGNVAAANGLTKTDVYDPTVYQDLSLWAWTKQTFAFVWAAPHPNSLYNRVLWTIGIEFQCSVLVYAAVSLFRGVAHRPFVHAVTGFVGLCIIGPDYLPFAFGVILAEGRFAAQPAPSPYPVLGWLLVLIGCWCGSVHPNPYRDWWLPFTSRLPERLQFETGVKVLYAVGAALLLHAAITRPVLTAALRTRLSQFLGFVSYPLYAVHQPLLYSVAAAVCLRCLPHLGYTAAALVGAGVAFVGSIGLAVVIARYVDAPWNQQVKTLVSKWMNREGGSVLHHDRKERAPAPFGRGEEEVTPLLGRRGS
jgi:peptidoglycan/LPS O-acetylase OafA/YrhL